MTNSVASFFTSRSWLFSLVILNNVGSAGRESFPLRGVIWGDYSWGDEEVTNR